MHHHFRNTFARKIHKHTQPRTHTQYNWKRSSVSVFSLQLILGSCFLQFSFTNLIFSPPPNQIRHTYVFLNTIHLTCVFVYIFRLVLKFNPLRIWILKIRYDWMAQYLGSFQQLLIISISFFFLFSAIFFTLKC